MGEICLEKTTPFLVSRIYKRVRVRTIQWLGVKINQIVRIGNIFIKIFC